MAVPTLAEFAPVAGLWSCETAIDLDAATNAGWCCAAGPRACWPRTTSSSRKGSAARPVRGRGAARLDWIGIDATVRTWLSKAEGYLPAVELGEAVRASGIGRVVATRAERFPLGHAVCALPGWQRYGLVRTTR